MHSKLIFNVLNSKLRSAVKRISMGGYVNSLLDSGLLHHELNDRVRNIAFTNCGVFDGIDSEIKQEMTVLISGDKIIGVAHKDKIAIPESFLKMDLAGQIIMPGLIDSHAHLCSPFTYEVNIAAVRQMRKQLALNNMRTVSSGVTTVCDMGGPQGLIKEFQKLADKNDIPGPRYLNCFTLISPIKGKTLGYPTQVKLIDPFQAWLLEGQVATRPRSINDLKKLCYKIKDDGGMHIKTTYQSQPFSAKKHAFQDSLPVFSDDWMKALLRLAKETGMAVSIHSPFGEGVEKCVDLAIEVGSKIRIQHMTFDVDLKDTIVRKMSDHGYYIIPTVMVYGDAFEMPNFVRWLNSNPVSFMTDEASRQLQERMQNAIDQEKYSGHDVLELDNVYFRKQFDVVRRNTQKAHDAGIIGFGTDLGGTYSGFFGRIFSEIRHYLDFGISIFDTMKYLTSVNAKINGLMDRGVIKPGKLADLIVLRDSPVKDAAMLKDVRTVMKGGVFLKYDGADLVSA